MSVRGLRAWQTRKTVVPLVSSDARFRAETARELRSHHSQAAAVSVLIGAIAAIWSQRWSPAAPMMIWGGMFVAAHVAWFISALRMSMAPSAEGAREAGFALRAGTTVAGAVWGSLPLLTFPPELSHQMLFAVSLCAVTGVVTTVLRADWRAALLFIVFATIPFIVRLYGAGDDSSEAHVAMLIVWLSFLVVAAHHGDRRWRESMALRESEERLALLTQESPIMLYTASAQPPFRTTYLSPNTRELLGYDPAVVLSDPDWWRSRIHPDDESAVKRATDETLARDHSSVEYRFRAPDGSYRWLHDSLRLVRAPSGDPVQIVGLMADVDEPKRTALALQRSEAHFRSLFESSRDAVMVLAPPSWYYVSGNPASLAMFEVGSLAELIATSPWELSPETQPDGQRSAEKALDMIETAMERGSHSFEWLHRRTSGAEFPTTVLLARVQVGDEAFLQATVRDVTEAKRDQLALRKVSRAIENSPASVIITNADGIIEYVNPKFTEITGYTAEEAIGQTPRILKSGVHPRDFYERFWSTIKAGQEVTSEVCNRKKNGDLYWESQSVSSVRNERGEITHFVAIRQDITERRHLDEVLARQGQLQKMIAEIAADFVGANTETIGAKIATTLRHTGEFFNVDRGGLLQFAEDGGVNGHSQTWCRDGVTPVRDDAEHVATVAALVRQYGLLNRGAGARLLDVTELPAEAHRLGQRLTRHGIRSVLLVPVYNDTRTLAVLEFEAVRTRMHWPDDQLHGLSVVAQIMANALTGLEAELRLVALKEQAEAANRAKSSFLATMSHEIRTPMNGVLGSVEVLQQSSLTPYQSELAATIRESALSLLGSIDDILDFSKIEAGHFALEVEDVDLERLIEATSDTFRPLALQKGVRLSVFADPHLPRLVRADATRVRQIVSNLVGNAVKFSSRADGGGRVRVRIEPCPDERVRLEVIDNGIGMSPEIQGRLFHPFTQGDVSTTRRYGGTGLGLSICKRLVDLMGGTISVSSEPGVGSRFAVTLPLAAVESEVVARRASPLADVGVAMVVSDPTDARDWRETLSHAGATVVVHPDLESASRCECVSVPPCRVLLAEVEREALDVPALWQAGWRGAVRIGTGRRQRPRMESSRVVQLDSGAMHGSDLIHAVAVAAGRSRVQSLTPTYLTPTPDHPLPDLDEAALSGRLILVAEDNEINRRVIRQQLAVLGFAAQIAEDGRAALRLWRTGRHALLLTDLHMPEMDGYSLTDAIRREEDPDRRLPIIALTANALRSERERCLAAGMDDYLSKPVPLDRLGATLERWIAAPTVQGAVPAGSPAQESRAEPTPSVQSPDFDPSVLSSLMAGDTADLEGLLQSFQRSASEAVRTIASATASGDCHRVAEEAHKLKSSARSVGALALGELCAELERASRAMDGGAVRRLAARCDAVFLAFRAALAQHKATI